MAIKTFEGVLDRYPPEVQDLARKTRRLVLELLPDAEESVDSSVGVVGYGYGAGYRGLICTIILSRSGVKLGLSHGAELPDPNGLLQGAGKVHRHVAIMTASDLRRPGVKPLLRAAAAAWRRRERRL